jgi:hypothetical protein
LGTTEPVIFGEVEPDVEREKESDSEEEKEIALWEKEYSTWKDVTCACGFGYYNIMGEWISGADVRAGLAPLKAPTNRVGIVGI